MNEIPENYQAAIRNMYRDHDGNVNEEIATKAIDLANKDPIGFMSGYSVNSAGRLVNNLSNAVVARFDVRALNNNMLTPIDQLGAYPVYDTGAEILEANLTTPNLGGADKGTRSV